MKVRVGLGWVVLLGLAAFALGADEAGPDRWIEALASEDGEERYGATVAIWRAGQEAKKAVPALAAILADSDVRVRRMACRALCGMGAEAGPVAKKLGAALGDKDAEVQRWAAFALWRMGPDAEPAREAITQFTIRVRDRETREALLETVALIRATDPATRENLLYFAGRRHLVNGDVLRRALQAAWPEGPERERFLENHIEALRSSRAGPRGEAGEVLAAFGDEALERAAPLLGARPGRLSIEMKGMKNTLASEERLQLQVILQNEENREFWIPIRNMEGGKIHATGSNLIRTLHWGDAGTWGGCRHLRAYGGGHLGRPFRDYRVVGPAESFILTRQDWRAPGQSGKGIVAFRAASENVKGPKGMRPWTGELEALKAFFVVEERHWAAPAKDPLGLSATLGVAFSKTEPGRLELRFTLTNESPELRWVYALGETRKRGLWFLIARAEGREAVAMGWPDERGGSRLDMKKDLAGLDPSAAREVLFSVPAPDEPGDYRIRAGFGRVTHSMVFDLLDPDDVELLDRLEKGKVWEGELMSPWVAITVK